MARGWSGAGPGPGAAGYRHRVGATEVTRDHPEHGRFERRAGGLLLGVALVAGLVGCADDGPAARVEQGASGVSITFPVGADTVTLPQQAPAGGRAARQGDGAVLVLDAEDHLLVAYLPAEPEGLVRLSGSGRQVEARLREDGEARTEAVTVTIDTADSLISQARWITRDDGLVSLEVTPTQEGRRWTSAAAMDAAWRQVLDAVPDADTEGMREQYLCHARFASRKEGWYLEPWRPAGSFIETVAARCNRGPQSDPEL